MQNSKLCIAEVHFAVYLEGSNIYVVFHKLDKWINDRPVQMHNIIDIIVLSLLPLGF